MRCYHTKKAMQCMAFLLPLFISNALSSLTIPAFAKASAGGALFTIHHSLFTIHYSPFTIHYSPFTIYASAEASIYLQNAWRRCSRLIGAELAYRVAGTTC